ncbi:hypothetical protein SUGI_0038510 [Cryptomeria japonica]|nr:hypothetical protein SUGI_0038510 [Cryptomeria japonica]
MDVSHLSALDGVPSPPSVIFPRPDPPNSYCNVSHAFLSPPSSSRVCRMSSVPHLHCSHDGTMINDWDSKLVVNLSSVVLDSLSFNFLKRGLGLSLTPHTIPHLDFLFEIENLIRSLPSGVSDEVRQDCVVALRNARPPECNIPKSELLAFNKLLSNHDLIITIYLTILVPKF